jgi:hypothetical protein
MRKEEIPVLRGSPTEHEGHDMIAREQIDFGLPIKVLRVVRFMIT